MGEGTLPLFLKLCEDFFVKIYGANRELKCEKQIQITVLSSSHANVGDL